MKNKLAICIAVALLASCATRQEVSTSDGMVDTTPDGTSTASTLHA